MSLLMPFGKYKAEDICDVPIDYLKWLEEQNWMNEGFRKDVQFEIERRTGDRSSMGRIVKGKVRLT